ncbi:phosphoesterase [Microbacterium phage OneinaGillian]|uniref:Phosphoesterase n=1 Tax=Microbacterium phage OneinaGillian TaxID=2301604 RepID=A0A385UJB0_9CAUD|nr:phosphoesterase [Microbacterium phage OneinaGillian]AYB70139.1 phosphoesterase [Microbacterium phage OneinaGillian]
MVAADLTSAPIPQTTQGTSVTVDWTGMGAQNGDVLVMFGRSQGTIPADITPPAGFTRMGTTGTVGAGDRFQGIFTHVVTDIATDPLVYTFTGLAGSSSRITVAKAILRGADLAHVNDGGLLYRADNFLPSVEAQAYPYTVYAMWGGEFTAGNSVVPNDLAGWEVVLVAQGTGVAIVANDVTTSSRTGIIILKKVVQSAGSLTVPAASLTWPGTASSAKSSSWIVRGQSAITPVGLPVKLGNGAAARLSYLDGAGVRKTPARVSLWLPGFASPEAFSAVAGATAAHRGGSLNFPEYSEYAYDRSVLRGYPTLEFSCGFSSDNEVFGFGDLTLDRMAGVTGDIDPRLLTWAEINSTYRNVLRPVAPGVTQPFYRLEDFLAKYTPTHVCLVDPKYGWSNAARVSAMLDICDANGGPEKIVIKFDSPLTVHTLVDAAHEREYLTMNYWGTEIDKLNTTHGTDRWDWIGVRYDADQAMYDAAIAIGKPVWAAVIPDQAGYNLAMSRGADMAMISGVAAVTPVR